MLNLVLATSLLVAAGGGDASMSADRAAEKLRALFPGTQTTRAKVAGSSQLIVAPVHRGKRVGYAHNIRGITASGVSFLAFELRLIDKPANVDTKDGALDIVPVVAATRQVHQVIALIALDKKGKVLGKPDGWPIEADVDEEVVGDLAVLQYVRINKLEELRSTTPGAWLEYQHDGGVFALALVAPATKKAKTKTAKPVRLRGLVSGADCSIGRRVTAEQFKCDLDVTVTETCEPNAEMCADACRESGLDRPKRTQNRTWIKDVCP